VRLTESDEGAGEEASCETNFLAHSRAEYIVMAIHADGTKKQKAAG
jgi:hypothetical protein